jgi:hypothetical protein
MMLFGAALLFSAVEGYAQTPNLQFGVIGGVSIAKLVGDDVEDAESRNAPFFGGTLVVQPAGSLGFETGFLYMPKGASSSFDDGTQEVTGTLKFDYVEVPLLLRLGINLQGSPIKPVVLLGGYVGFKAGCEVEAEGDGASAEFDCEQIDLEIKGVDYGVTGGLSVDIPVGARAILTPTARYSRGLTDVPDVDDADVKNSAIQLGASFRISL